MRTRDEQKIKAIHEQAVTMIVQDGFDGFSMQKLARAAGVSPATLYIYFKDREDLILQVFARVAREMSVVTLKDFDPAMPFAEGLQQQWLNRAKFCLKHPDKMHFMEQMRHSALRDRYMEFLGDDIKLAMKAFVSKAIREGELVPLPVEVFWAIAYAPLYMLVKFHMEGMSIGGKSFRFSRPMMQQTLALVLKALKPEHAPATLTDKKRAHAEC